MGTSTRSGIGWVVAGCCLCGTVAAARAVGPRPTCAILVDPADALASGPSVALLADGLERAGTVTLVDRSATAAVLKEQAVSTLFGPGAVAGRIELGRLVHAELLVLLRTETGPPAVTRVVVCQAATGLRLVSQPTARADPEADAAALLAVVNGGVARAAGAVTQVVAVPPFVDRSPGYDAARYRLGLADLLEQAVARRPGVVTVELAEARAIGQEIALGKLGDGPGGVARPSMPVYLLGEYRQDGSGDAARLTFAVSANRGEAPLGTVSGRDLSPAQLAAVVVDRAAGLIDRAVGPATRPAPPPDPVGEARQLAARSDAFAALGEWDESLALAEASLLLNGDQPKLERAAAVAAAGMADRAAPRVVQQPVLARRAAAQHARLLRPGLSHLEAYLTAMPVNQTRDFGLIVGYLAGGLDDDAPEMMLRVLRAKRDRHVRDDAPRFAIQAVQGCFATTDVPADQRDGVRARAHAWCLQAVAAFPDSTDPAQVIQLACRGCPTGRGPAVEAVAAELDAAGTDLCTRTAALIRRRLAAGSWAFSDLPPEKYRHVDNPPAEADPEVVATDTGLRNLCIANWMSAGDGVDAVCLESTHGGRTAQYEFTLCLMKQRGRLTQVADVIGYGTASAVAYDGKYLWAGLRKPGLANVPDSPAAAGESPPEVVVVDPRTEKRWVFPMDHGVPQQPLIGLACAPLGPGRVCLVGAYGHGVGDCRTWVAVATFDDANPGRCGYRVIHEATAARSDPPGATQWHDPHVSFWPAYAVTATGPATGGDRPPQRVLVGRFGGRHVGPGHPLLVDPDGGTVSVVSQPVAFGRWPPVVKDGVVYGAGDTRKPSLYRFGFPDLTAIADPRPLAQGGSVCLVGNRTWVINDFYGTLYLSDGPTRPFRKLRFNVPKGIFQDITLFDTQFYGLMLVTESGYRAYSVAMKGE